MKSKRTKALEISPAVKAAVRERDGGRCIFCDAPGLPEAHFVARSQGGLGIEENILTVCRRCHRLLDESHLRRYMKDEARRYLRSKYPEWDEERLHYRKGGS